MQAPVVCILPADVYMVGADVSVSPPKRCFDPMLCSLQELEDYAALPDDLVGSAKRWQEWMELERPEDEPLPGDWKRMPEFERLLIFRTLRPDRLTAAMQRFVANTIGKEYTASQQYDLERSFQVNSLFAEVSVCGISSTPAADFKDLVH